MFGFAVAVLRVKLTFSQTGEDIKIDRLWGREPSVNIFLLKSRLWVYTAEISERLDLHMGGARRDLGHPVPFLSTLSAAHDGGRAPWRWACRGPREWGHVPPLLGLILHRARPICAPSWPSTRPEPGRQEKRWQDGHLAAGQRYAAQRDSSEWERIDQ